MRIRHRTQVILNESLKLSLSTLLWLYFNVRPKIYQYAIRATRRCFVDIYVLEKRIGPITFVIDGLTFPKYDADAYESNNLLLISYMSAYI